MVRSRELKVVILGDSSQAQRAFSQLSGAADGLQGKLEAVSAKMRRAGRNMTIGITTPLALLGKQSFDAASDMNESFSKVQTVFGAAGKDIDAFSKTAAKSMGLSRQETLDAAGTFGNMFTQLGIGAPVAADLSKEMIKLAADLGSFHNADITQVIEAQSSAFRGEYDALQRFVPTINAAAVEQKALQMTGKNATKELTLQEKALAVQKLMMEGAGSAVGDFARTADGAANKQRIMTAELKDASAELGNKLMPIGQKVIGLFSKLAGWYDKLSPKTQNLILVVAGLAAALGPLVTVLGALGAVLTFIAAHPVVVAIGLLAAALIYAYTQSETFRSIVNAAFEAVSKAAGFMKDVVVGYISFIVDKWLAAVEWIVRGAARAFGWVPGIGGKLRDAATKIENFRDRANSALGGINGAEVNVGVRGAASAAWQAARPMPAFMQGGRGGGNVTNSYNTTVVAQTNASGAEIAREVSWRGRGWGR